MVKTYQKPFNKQYKEVKIAAPIGIIGGLLLTVPATIQMTEKIPKTPNIFSIVLGAFFLFYSCILFSLYWKCAQYQKNNQTIPKWFRITAGLFLMLYLTFYQLDKKKYRYYLVLKEWRFYVLLWFFICALTTLLSLYPIIHDNKKVFWLLITLSIETVVFIINLIIMIFIWKYQGTKNKFLILLTIITLNFRNYRFYKEIIEFNTKEKSN
ncbi:hypothetical protein LT336_00781 [Spiroplasma sp. JKS002671]|uniref:hypothetical protein n=1 Tax=Spiroplasma attinicola TaxID=2904537 RepID=UPI002022AA90|nr:hypothetical protein [Spiroplasma sp. JKS002671]MCL8211029.1 hypothetical protein [Spiroplasma sp. JKS002671]